MLELKEKIGLDIGPAAPHADLTARDALVELGYSLVDAEAALARVDRDLPVEEQVRLALKAAA